jgi:hypothetical protein
MKEHEQKMLVALHALAMNWGQHNQNQARTSARWEDRSGNARSGIFFAVDGFGFPAMFGQLDLRGASASAGTKGERIEISGSKDKCVIVLAHTMYYGKFLELANGGKYAVIMSTMESNLPVLERQLAELMR